MTVRAKRVLIVDDHPLFADGLSLVLGNLAQIGDVSTCNNGLEALSDPNTLSGYDLVLADLDMPKLSGFGFLMAVETQGIDIEVAIVSGSVKKFQIERALQLGAKGFIPKDSDTSEMLKAVTQLLEGRRYLPRLWEGVVDWKPQQDAKSIRTGALTERQMQILALISEGMQNKQIALALGISVSSVKGHVELLFKNLGVSNRSACVQVANEQSLI